MLYDENLDLYSRPVNLKIFDEVQTLNDLEEYLPNVMARTPDELKEFVEIQEIAKAAEPEFKLIMTILLRWHYNIFPSHATEDGIKEWESWLELIREHGDSLDDRRTRVKGKFNERLPYTWVRLYRMLAGVCGWDGFEMSLDELEYRVKLSMDSASQFGTVVKLLKEFLPQYLLWVISQYSKASSTEYYACVIRETTSMEFSIIEDEPILVSNNESYGTTVRDSTTTHLYRLDISDIA